MALRNSIIFDKGGKIKLDTSGTITLPNVETITKIECYSCPLRLQDAEGWKFENKILTVNKPGRYLIEYD